MIIQGCRTWSLAPLAIPWDPRQFLQLVRSASSPTMGGFTARATPPPSCDPLAQAGLQEKCALFLLEIRKMHIKKCTPLQESEKCKGNARDPMAEILEKIPQDA